MVPTVNPVTEETEVVNGSARWHVRSDVANKIIIKKLFGFYKITHQHFNNKKSMSENLKIK